MIRTTLALAMDLALATLAAALLDGHYPRRIEGSWPMFITKENTMNHAAFALAHPVLNPEQQIIRDHTWAVDRGVSACLTVNIGME